MKKVLVTRLFVVLSLACLFAVAVYSQAEPPIDFAQGIVDRVNEVLCVLFAVLLYISASVVALSMVWAGAEYMTSEDSVRRMRARNRVIYSVIGLILVLVACPVVNYLVTNTSILPFNRSCNCNGQYLGPVATTSTTNSVATTATATTAAGGSTTTAGSTTTTKPPVRILIYTTGITPGDDVMEPSALKTFIEGEGYTTDLVARSEKLSPGLLSKYRMVWIMETSQSTHPGQDEIDAVISYHNSGGCLVLSGEGDSDTTVTNYYVDFVNDIANRVGVTFSSPLVINGNTDSCAQLTAGNHPVINGVSTLSSTGSDAYLTTTNGNVQVAASFEGKAGIMALDGTAGQGPIFFDNSEVRFTSYGSPTSGPNSCDSAKYIRNLLKCIGN